MEKVFRTRRGKLVEVPEEWVGVFPTKKTMRGRQSNLINKVKREAKTRDGRGSGYLKYKTTKESPLLDPLDLIKGN